MSLAGSGARWNTILCHDSSRRRPRKTAWSTTRSAGATLSVWLSNVLMLDGRVSESLVLIRTQVSIKRNEIAGYLPRTRIHLSTDRNKRCSQAVATLYLKLSGCNRYMYRCCLRCCRLYFWRSLNPHRPCHSRRGDRFHAGRGRRPVHAFHDQCLYSVPRIEVVIQELPKISTTPAWHLPTRKTTENSGKGIADAKASQQPAECHHDRCSIHCRASSKEPRTWPEASPMSASLQSAS